MDFDCEGCGYVITCRHYTMGNEHWHITCLTCTNCGNTFDEGDISKVYNRDGKVYCKDCMAALFQLCEACGEPAKKFVNACGKIWHTFHFKCADCQSILDDYVEVNEKAYCQNCYKRLSARVTKKRRSFGTEKRQSGGNKPKSDSSKPWTPSIKANSSPAPTSQPEKTTAAPRGWLVTRKFPVVAASSASVTPSTVPTPASTAPSPTSSNSSPRLSIASPSFTKSPPMPTTVSVPLQATATTRFPIGSPTSPAHSTSSPSPPLTAAAKAARRTSGKYTAMPHPPLQSYNNTPVSLQSTNASSFSSAVYPPSNTPTSAAVNNSTTPVSFKNPPAWLRNASDKGVPGKRESGKLGSSSTGSIIPASSVPVSSNLIGAVNSNTSSGALYSTTTVGANGSSSTAPAVTRPRATASSTPVIVSNTRGDGVSIAEILEIILRPLAEPEIGSIGYQASVLLSQIHQESRLHKNIKHTTIFINSDGVLSLGEGDGENEEESSSIRFKAPETKLTQASDIYSLGVALWTSADYLLDDDEEPVLSVEFCDLIGLMTDDVPASRPALKSLISYLEKYKDYACSVLAATMKEVERKKALKKEIQESIVQKQKSLIKLLVKEIVMGVKLHKLDRNSIAPPIKTVTPYEEMCKSIRDFNTQRLRKVDFSKVPQRQHTGGPRERLLAVIRSSPRLNHVTMVAGREINTLILPVPNFPKYGFAYRDTAPLLREPKVTLQIAKSIAAHFRGSPPSLFMATPTDCGIYFASLVAEMLNRGVVILQNTGRLPRKLEKYSAPYEAIGYAVGNMELQVPKYLLQPGEKVVIIDELLTNGGVIEAAFNIVHEAGGTVQEVVCLAELTGYRGRERLEKNTCPLFVMYQFSSTSEEQ